MSHAVSCAFQSGQMLDDCSTLLFEHLKMKETSCVILNEMLYARVELESKSLIFRNPCAKPSFLVLRFSVRLWIRTPNPPR